MIKSLSLVLVFFGAYSMAEVKAGACDSKISAGARFVQEKSPYHEASVSGKTVQVGGDAARYAKNMDSLALQRGLIACSPGFVQCLADQKLTDTANFLVTMKLNPSKETAEGSDVNIRWTTVQMSAAEPCLKDLISNVKYGMALKEAVMVSVPVKIIVK